MGSVLLLLMPFPARKDKPVGPLAGIDEYVKVALADWKTPGMALAVLKDGKVVLARGYGVRRVGDQDFPRTWTNHDWLDEAEEKLQEELKAKNARLEAERAKDTEPSLPLTAIAEPTNAICTANWKYSRKPAQICRFSRPFLF